MYQRCLALEGCQILGRPYAKHVDEGTVEGTVEDKEEMRSGWHSAKVGMLPDKFTPSLIILLSLPGEQELL